MSHAIDSLASAARAAIVRSFGDASTPSGVLPAAFSEAQTHLADAVAKGFAAGMSLKQIQAAAASAAAAYTEARNREQAEVAARHNRSIGPFGPRFLPIDTTLQVLLINRLHVHR